MNGSRFQELRDREQQIRRELIIDAAEKLLSRKALYEISMRDIAMAAKISVASIYRYVKSQDDLLSAVLSRNINKAKELIQGSSGFIFSSIEELSCVFVDYLLDNEAAIQIACHFLVQRNKKMDVVGEFKSFREIFINRFYSEFIPMDGENHSQILLDSFFASIFGIVITYGGNNAIGTKKQREPLYERAKLIGRSLNNSIVNITD